MLILKWGRREGGIEMRRGEGGERVRFKKMGPIY